MLNREDVAGGSPTTARGLVATELASVGLAGVTQGYGKHVVLDNLSVEFGTGVTALVGPNGAGKSTLLRTLVTDLAPRSGSVVYGETLIVGRRAVRDARRMIGFLPQGFTADPSFSVTDLVRYAAWLREADTSNTSVAAALAAVGLMDQARSKIKSLSGGMKQRVAIAATIVGAPPVLVFDEPTVGLDPEQRIYFREVLSQFSGHIVILSTHLIEDVVLAAGRVVILASGKVVFDGSPVELAGLAEVVPGGVGAGASAAERGYLAVVQSIRP